MLTAQFPGANNINDGVLIAPNGLRDLKVNNADSNIEVGPGNKWVDVYSALAPYGSYTIGGRLKSIGVPGLTLIGGVSYFLNKYGFAMDNVIRYNVVLGNGTQVEASKSANRDLFWALKGGANNFGIVTKFVFQTYHIPKVTSTFQIFEEAHVQDFIRAACDMALTDTGAVGAGAVINMSYNTTTKVVTPQVFGLQEGVQVPPSRFSSFTKIPAVVRQHNVTEPVVWHSQFDTPNQMFRYVWVGMQYLASWADTRAAFNSAITLSDRMRTNFSRFTNSGEVQSKISPKLRVCFRPLSSTWCPPARRGLPTATVSAIHLALPRNQPFVRPYWLAKINFQLTYCAGWQFATSWARQEDDLRMSAWTQSLLELAQRKTKAKGLATDFVYMGDAGEFQKPFEAYGYGNINKMRGIRDKYDHGKVFSRLNWGGFKLG